MTVLVDDHTTPKLSKKVEDLLVQLKSHAPVAIISVRSMKSLEGL
ncbi:MAG: hypothetical protein HQK53_07505 [Oligoflexia bacterium]|nr:hypothetical protein [Oligoflexia bacterium]